MNTRNLPTLALASLLTLGFAGAALAQAPVAPDETDMKSDQPVSDTWITTKVKSELATTEGVKSMDISVKTVDGVVTLVGVQDNDMAVKKAIAVARSVKGVKDVDASALKSK